MRFSTALALCAAPLAMAGTVQDGLYKRTEPMAMAEKAEPSPKEGGSGKTTVEVQSGDSKIAVQGSVTEIIIIWVNNGGGATTSTSDAAKTLPPPPAAAATHSVMVGGSAGLVYTPESVSAAVGDMVIFTFMSANHTVTQSAFAAPCVKLAGGMDSGFMPNANDTIVPAPQMAMQVTVATPIWFYCRQKTHCGKGMTFSINPTAAKTQAMFKGMAVAQNGTGTLAPIQGGTAAPPASAGVAPPAASPPPAAAAPPAAAPPAAAPPAAAPPAAIASGSGQQEAGACACSCFCGVSAFPLAAQGLGGYGGMSGAMPMAMLEK